MKIKKLKSALLRKKLQIISGLMISSPVFAGNLEGAIAKFNNNSKSLGGGIALALLSFIAYQWWSGDQAAKPNLKAWAIGSFVFFAGAGIVAWIRGVAS